MQMLLQIPRRALVWMIDVYQKTLSPDHGPLKHLYPYGYCRHEPTCSMYGKQVILERGAIVGGFLAFKRILGCNPFTKLSDEKLQAMAKKALR